MRILISHFFDLTMSFHGFKDVTLWPLRSVGGQPAGGGVRPAAANLDVWKVLTILTVVTVLGGCVLGVWTVLTVFTILSGGVLIVWTVLTVFTVLRWGVLDVCTVLKVLTVLRGCVLGVWTVLNKI